MSKFKVGDAVVFSQMWVEALQDDTSLDLYQPQIVSETKVSGDVKVQGDDDWWDESYWEPFEEWAKHQKKAVEHQSPPKREYQVCELELGEAKRLLKIAAQKLEDCHCDELADEINIFLETSE